MFGPLILVMTSGRAGSSMICGLIAKHGVWTGPTKSGDKRNPDGFFENMQVYKACGHYGQFKRDGETGIAEHDGLWPDQFKKLVKAQGYKNGPLVIKHIPNCWPIWDDLSPIYVTVRRDIEAMIKSRDNINKPLERDVIEGREKAMDWLEKNRSAIRIDSEDIIKGDYYSLGVVLEKAGVTLNKRICRDFVNPTYWHY